MIRIGADELILWLRKNRYAENVKTIDLGGKIRKTIEENLGGHIVEREQECFWANADGDKNVGEFALPKTATQYFINENKLPELYREMSLW